MKKHNVLYGYSGWILRVDLTHGGAAKKPWPRNWRDATSGAADSWRNSSGTRLPGKRSLQAGEPARHRHRSAERAPAAVGGKTQFGTKSPATVGYADSNMGGHLARR